MPALTDTLFWGLAGLMCLAPIGGCMTPWRKSEEVQEQERLEELVRAPKPPALVREAAAPYGLRYGKIQSFGIVNGLAGTGGQEPPSMQRDLLLAEMKTRDVEDPNTFIDSENTALVMVEAVIPPGVRRGDPLDLIVKTSQRTEATSLRGGWLMPARLSFTQIIGGMPRTSDTLATGTGPVIVRAAHQAGDDPQLLLEGRVLAGGVAQKDGHLDLRIRPEYRHVAISKRLAEVINRRFYFFDGSARRGIANAKEDDLIAIETHPRYRHNVHRMMAVVGLLGTEADIAETHARIDTLAKQLLEPTSASDAALQLEGIGDEGVPALLAALTSSNPEIQFYAAEALAYLDRVEAVEPLVELSRDQPAFRYHTLQALAGMEKERRAAEGLRKLLDESSTETRFGAFDAIRRRADRNVILSGSRLGESDQRVNFFDVPSKGGPLVAISLRRSPDLVVFDGPIPIKPPEYLFCGCGILIVANGAEGLQISRILPGREDTHTTAPATVRGLAGGIVQVGGSYGDIVEALRLAKEQGFLSAALAIDVLPQPLREYHRGPSDSGSSELDPAALPPQRIDPPEEAQPERGWYDPRGWFSSINLSSAASVA